MSTPHLLTIVDKLGDVQFKIVLACGADEEKDWTDFQKVIKAFIDADQCVPEIFLQAAQSFACTECPMVQFLNPLGQVVTLTGSDGILDFNGPPEEYLEDYWARQLQTIGSLERFKDPEDYPGWTRKRGPVHYSAVLHMDKTMGITTYEITYEPETGKPWLVMTKSSHRRGTICSISPRELPEVIRQLDAANQKIYGGSAL